MFSQRHVLSDSAWSYQNAAYKPIKIAIAMPAETLNVVVVAKLISLRSTG